jgi:hypothetical protein
LLLQQAAQTTAGIRAAKKSSSSSSANKKRLFNRLKGLPVTNEAINSVTAKSGKIL